MARPQSIPRSEYPVILRLSDAERVKTVDIAVTYGVAPRTINIILGKARADSAGAGAPAVNDSSPAVLPPALAALEVAAPAVNAQVVEPEVGPVRLSTQSWDMEVAVPPETPAPVKLTVSAVPPARAAEKEPVERNQAARPKGNSKAAYGLVTKTDDGEESIAPYRSLEDLLSTVKGTLRTAAQASDEVWFAIREIDLSDFEE